MKFAQIHVPIHPADRHALRRKANELGVTYGLLARALILEGLNRRPDESFRNRLAAESEIDRERRREAGRTAIAERYGREE